MTIPPRPTRQADVAFAALTSGAVGSAAVALTFLLVDALRGQPFFTPSLMGSLVFGAGDPGAAEVLRLDFMALYTLLHFSVFSVLGVLSTLAYERLSGTPGRPLALGAAILATLSLGAGVVDAVVFPGLLASVGTAPVTVAHTVAATAMGWLIHSTMRGEEGAPVTARVSP